MNGPVQAGPLLRHDPGPREEERLTLQKDAVELNNVYGDSGYAEVVGEGTEEMIRLDEEPG